MMLILTTPQGFFNSRTAMNALVTYLKHVRTEMGHVAWPSTRTAIAHTLVVIAIAVVIALLVGLLDYLFAGVVSRIIGV